MKTKKRSGIAWKIMAWIGEASWGCLESTSLPFDFPVWMRWIPAGQMEHKTPKGQTRRRGWKAGAVGAVFLLGVLVSPSRAQDLTPNQRWIEQVDGGFVIPASRGASSGYGLGVGGDILVGYRFTRDFSLSADLGYYDCDQKTGGASAGEWVYTPLMAVGRFNFGSGPVRPYLLLGGGLALNTYSLTPSFSGKQSNQEADLLLSPGLGVLVVVASNMAVYAQGRVDIDFTSQGALGSPFTDSPIIFIPLKAGISFFVL